MFDEWIEILTGNLRCPKRPLYQCAGTEYFQDEDNLGNDDYSGSPPQVTKSICFCCEDGRAGEIQLKPESGNERNKRETLPRSGRTIKIESPRQSARVYRHQNFIRKSLNCVDQVGTLLLFKTFYE